MLRLGAERRKQLRTKKSHGDAPSECGNRCLFTPIAATRSSNPTRKIAQCATGIMLTYTVNEFVSPRVKFLPKAAPVDCALLPFTMTRHFLSFLCGGREHEKRKSGRRERARLARRGNTHTQKQLLAVKHQGR